MEIDTMMEHYPERLNVSMIRDRREVGGGREITKGVRVRPALDHNGFYVESTDKAMAAFVQPETMRAIVLGEKVTISI